MTKREEIRDGIDLYTDDRCLYPEKTCISFKENYCIEEEGAYKCLMKRLDGLGVVIKVDRELPPFAYVSEQDLNAKTEIQNSILRAGYVATEPLIEEE